MRAGTAALLGFGGAAAIAGACSPFTGDAPSAVADGGTGPDAPLEAGAEAATPPDAASSCDGGLCTPATLIEGEAVPRHLAARGGFVFWALESGAVRACQVNDCKASVRTIAGAYPKAGIPGGIAIDTGHVYWTVPLNSVVFRAPLGATNATPEPYPAFDNGYYPIDTVVDNSQVFWTTESPDEVRSCPTSGGCTKDASVQVATSIHPFTRALAMNNTDLFWVTGDADDDAGIIFTAPKTGGVAVPLRYSTPGPRGIAVHGNAAFVTSWLAGEVSKGVVFRIIGASASTVLVSDQPEPTAIVVDSANVYWTNLGDGSIRRCAIDGCSSQPTIVASSQGTPESIADDKDAIYWADSTNGRIVRLPK
jgi:hypothetical protein